jgi:hypothetical protein
MQKNIAFIAVTLGVMAVSFLAGQATGNFDRWWKPELEATVAAPENHKILFENDEVRVLEVTVEPGRSERLHVHRYASVIYLESSPHLIEHLQDGTSRDLGARPKGAFWLPIAQGHYMENVDTFPLHAIRFELKKDR